MMVDALVYTHIDYVTIDGRLQFLEGRDFFVNCADYSVHLRRILSITCLRNLGKLYYSAI
jgi:hypothetical protein